MTIQDVLTEMKKPESSTNGYWILLAKLLEALFIGQGFDLDRELDEDT